MSADGPAGCDEPNCQAALEQLEAFLDGELPSSRIDDVREHLRACYPCTDRATFEEQLRALVRRECLDTAPPGLLDRVEAALQAPGPPTVRGGEGASG